MGTAPDGRDGDVVMVRRAADLDLKGPSHRTGFPSPVAWEDEVLYFLLLDRFSDDSEAGYRGNEGGEIAGVTPLFTPANVGDACTTATSAAQWRAAGAAWVGGNLVGLRNKIGYLQRLGVSAIWVSPVFKQVVGASTYHGYGIQDFLAVDPHFGTVADLKAMVATAHDLGIRVILDIILNHTGDVLAYDPDRYWTTDSTGRSFWDPRWDGNPYRVVGFRDDHNQPTIPFVAVDLDNQPAPSPDGGVWPAELYEPAAFTQKGRISNWDHSPEYLEGDFETLKNVYHGTGTLDDYRPSTALIALTRAYQYWIAEADIDGYRVDTVKHMEPGAVRFFAASIHNFAACVGKDHFYLIGEITGGRSFAYDTLEHTGLDAALGIDEIPTKLEGLVKGWTDPMEYFALFRDSLLVNKASHVWFRNKVVTVIDDHDQVCKGQAKARFCADDVGAQLALPALALNATTIGIPCIYYGSEQGFDGSGDDDRYIREAMFGGAFGAFRSHKRHFFDETGPIYCELAKILGLRRERIALRRGHQYLREISADGVRFGLPRTSDDCMPSLVAWSRIIFDREVLLAINIDTAAPVTAVVTVDSTLHSPGDTLCCIYSVEPAEIGQEVAIVTLADSRATVRLTIPRAGFVAYE